MSDEKIQLEMFRSSLGLDIEDPWDRVKYLFLKNHHGESHPDLLETFQMAQMGFLGGVVYGGLLYQKEYLLNIKERSDAKIYHSRHQAYRQISSESLVGFVKGGIKWGPKMAIFAGGFKLFSSCVEAYRNKSGIIEYSIGGSLIGGFLRFNFGIRGILVGSLVGMALGTVYGSTHFGLIKMLKLDVVEIKYGQYALSKHMEQRKTEKLAEYEAHNAAKEGISENLNPLSSWNDDESPQNNKQKEKLNE